MCSAILFLLWRKQQVPPKQKHTSAKLRGTQPEIREFVTNISKNTEFHIQ